MNILMEGEYFHHKSAEINELYSYIKPAVNYLEKQMSRNKQILFQDIAFSETKEHGVRGFKDFYLDNEQSIYRDIPFEPHDSLLLKANNETPLSFSFILTKGLPLNATRKAYYERGKGHITIRIDLDAEAYRRYNFLVTDIPKHLYEPEKHIEQMEELKELKKRLYYYIDSYLIKLVMVHEMTHWLDDIYDNGIYDFNTDKNTSWINMESEQNAILHQIKYLKTQLKNSKWNQLTLIDILVLVRIRRDFIHGILQDVIKHPRNNWAVSFTKKMKKYKLNTTQLFNFNPDEYYKISLLVDKKGYRDYYLYLRNEIF